MAKKAAKLLDRLHQSKAGWKPDELMQILSGHGFARKKESRHGTFFEHPEYPVDTTVIIPRHTPCKKWVALKVLKAVQIVNAGQAPTEDPSL